MSCEAAKNQTYAHACATPEDPCEIEWSVGNVAAGARYATETPTGVK